LLSQELTALKEFLKENLKKKFIKESKSSADVSILFVFKKNNSLQLYIDYRDLNVITIKNQYLLFLIIEIINQVTRTEYFSKVNLKDIYYRLQIKAEDK
jgi:hypothetical protein